MRASIVRGSDMDSHRLPRPQLLTREHTAQRLGFAHDLVLQLHVDHHQQQRDRGRGDREPRQTAKPFDVVLDHRHASATR
ncbi:hypothetical protein [Amycolatopsis alkalitolerans]|uniref:Uncharacterized protein n=1 Tax=Amycolatopsis alkalitolerans TaxID=2547244 RepID=A0A5C4LQX1_9PSEU|nr:hypothetical protein [Amycolatopsis alkalitolerans]TNC19064.1 hypothetical protein FG385_32885 [Amycolatopsis alkalitolerans]